MCIYRAVETHVCVSWFLLKRFYDDVVIKFKTCFPIRNNTSLYLQVIALVPFKGKRDFWSESYIFISFASESTRLLTHHLRGLFRTNKVEKMRPVTIIMITRMFAWIWSSRNLDLVYKCTRVFVYSYEIIESLH